MLTRDELVSLSHLLREAQVLSVYVNGVVHDPARRLAWRVELAHALDETRRSVAGSPRAERVAFEECVTLLEDRLARLVGWGTLATPGWVGFVTHDGVRLAEPVPAPVPTLAVWSAGMCLTPYVRALKQARPVVVVVTDARKARIYRCLAGALARLETIHAHVVADTPSHMGNPPSVGFHGGTHGETGEAAAQRAQQHGTARMITDVVRVATTLAGHDGWIVVGGIPGVAARLARAARHVAEGRVLHVQSLDVHATDAQLLATAQASASQLRDTVDLARVSDILVDAETRRTASCGEEATRSALEQGSVRELYFTERFFLDHRTVAEQAVRDAFDQGALVEEVSRDVAALLDAHGGIGARLRYALAVVPRVPTVSTGSNDREASQRP